MRPLNLFALSAVMVAGVWAGALLAEWFSPHLGATARVVWVVLLEAIALVCTGGAVLHYLAVESDEFEQQDRRTAAVLAGLASVAFFVAAGVVGALVWESSYILAVILIDIIAGAALLLWAEDLRASEPTFA